MFYVHFMRPHTKSFDDRTRCRACLFDELYPSQSQTKILEDRTNISEHVFEALFKGVSTRFGLQNVASKTRSEMLVRSSKIYCFLHGFVGERCLYFVPLGQKVTRCMSHIDRFLVGVRFVFCKSWPEKSVDELLSP
jgi:hypothetical protein